MIVQKCRCDHRRQWDCNTNMGRGAKEVGGGVKVTPDPSAQGVGRGGR